MFELNVTWYLLVSTYKKTAADDKQSKTFTLKYKRNVANDFKTLLTERCQKASMCENEFKWIGYWYMSEWWYPKHFFCRITAKECPIGLEYSDCASPCPRTCKALHEVMPDECMTSCISGCQCPSGQFYQDGKCIEPTECQCEYNNRRYNNTDEIRADCNKWYVHIGEKNNDESDWYCILDNSRYFD